MYCSPECTQANRLERDGGTDPRIVKRLNCMARQCFITAYQSLPDDLVSGSSHPCHLPRRSRSRWGYCCGRCCWCCRCRGRCLSKLFRLTRCLSLRSFPLAETGFFHVSAERLGLFEVHSSSSSDPTAITRVTQASYRSPQSIVVSLSLLHTQTGTGHNHAVVDE